MLLFGDQLFDSGFFGFAVVVRYNYRVVVFGFVIEFYRA